MKLRYALLLTVLVPGCSSQRVAPDPALEARRACAKLLWGKEVRSEEDLLALGRSQEAEGNPRCAEAAYQAATVLAPKDPRPYAALAGIFERRGDSRSAVKSWIELQKRVDPASEEWARASDRIRALAEP